MRKCAVEISCEREACSHRVANTFDMDPNDSDIVQKQYDKWFGQEG